MAQANGMVAGGDPNAAGQAGGAPGGDMGGGGMPPDVAGEGMGGAPGGDMGGGMGGAPGGDMGGGMGGGMGGAPMGAAASGGEMPTIGKRGSKNKQQEEEEMAPPPTPIKLTKLEGKMFKTLTDMSVPHDLFAQYQVKVPGEARPYAIDFAYPKIGVGIEVDGAIWHERPDFKQRDLNRDQNLGNVGWRILRFNEESLDENMGAVTDVIAKHVEEASKQKKAAEADEQLVKYASTLEVWENPQYEQCIDTGSIGCNRGEIPYGKILYIGNVING
jgi:very-short-patch-repair endonuclease